MEEEECFFGGGAAAAAGLLHVGWSKRDVSEHDEDTVDVFDIRLHCEEASNEEPDEKRCKTCEAKNYVLLAVVCLVQELSTSFNLNLFLSMLSGCSRG